MGTLAVVGAVLVASTPAAVLSGGDAAQAAAAPVPCAPQAVKLEGIPAMANPFDPAQITVDAHFTGPGGRTLDVPAFFDRYYDHHLENGVEHVDPAEPGGHWTVRATPPVAGTWSWSISTSVNGAPATVTPQADLTCETDPATGLATDHGFLRRSGDDPTQLVWDDGTPYLAVGENLGWPDQRGTYAYEAWLDRLVAHHVTWVRVWMPSWAFGIEWETLGDYAGRLDRAWQLDRVVELARARGIVVMLSIQNHGAFSTTSNSEWDHNPYNAANGGPLATPQQFFTDPTAKELFARRLRYVAARWGYATNLIWELWNEVDLTGAAPSDIVAWHDDMTNRLRGLDPSHHLVTTSVANPLDFLDPASAFAPLWSLDRVDLVQVHLYGVGADAPLDFTKVAVPNLPGIKARYGKPVLLAEAGVDYRGPAETLAADPDGQGFHELLWSGLFGGGSGSGMSWWWDNVIDPQDWYPTFDGLAALTNGVAFDRERFATTGATAAEANGATLDAFPLRGSTTTLVWVRNPANWWHQPDHRAIAGATLALTDLTPGTHTVAWIDPVTGASVAPSTVATTVAGVALVPVPTFAGETSVRLTWTSPTTTPTTSAPAPTSVIGAGTAGSSAVPVVAVPTFTG